MEAEPKNGFKIEEEDHDRDDPHLLTLDEQKDIIGI